jgi:hypothetical protein
MEPAVALDRAEPSFAQFIRARKADILDAWKTMVLRGRRAQLVDEPVLMDRVPDLLDRIAEVSDEFERGERGTESLPETAEHARQRITSGFNLAEVVEEYRCLREAILALWERTQTTQRTHPSASTLPVNRAIDHAVSEAVCHYVDLRERTLKALDDVATTALASTTLDELLSRLLRVFMDMSRPCRLPSFFFVKATGCDQGQRWGLRRNLLGIFLWPSARDSQAPWPSPENRSCSTRPHPICS